jgi:sarcosine oxidase
MTTYDAIVVGLGGAGSAGVYHLASKGMRVLGVEKYGPVHSHGSSHGKTRIYRTAYSEGPAYVPLVQRAQQLWLELQAASGQRIIQKTGGLVIGRRESRMVSGAIRSATAYSLPHDVLASDEIETRFPQFRVDESDVALWDPEAGALFPENCIQAHSSGAVDAGAELHYGETVRSWTSASEGVKVTTRTGEYRARTLVFTAGPWTPGLTSDIGLPLEIELQFVFWFAASKPEMVRPERMPAFIWDMGVEGQTYGLPDFGDGVKIGSWAGKVVPSPEAADRTLYESDAMPVRDFVSKSLDGVVSHEQESMSCLFTNSPDQDFVIGKHPRYPNVVVISACSGHGFKFTSVLGEIISHLVCNESLDYDLSPFDLGRFGSRT